MDLKKASKKIKKQQKKEDQSISIDVDTNLSELSAVPFSHLHNHSQFSILQSCTQIKNLILKASEMGMPAVGLTDIGNMMQRIICRGRIQTHLGIDKQIKEPKMIPIMMSAPKTIEKKSVANFRFRILLMQRS